MTAMSEAKRVHDPPSHLGGGRRRVKDAKTMEEAKSLVFFDSGAAGGLWRGS